MEEQKYTANEFMKILIHSGLSRASLRAVASILDPDLMPKFEPKPRSTIVKDDRPDGKGNIPW